ncbi:MAG TPA: hypothetical protein VED40_11005 [Azospirillaceae bacterium]|nr:hypothetical protein [Azospirillaceae bacterium]
MSFLGGGATGTRVPGVTFEVQFFKKDHWVTETVCRTEEEALALAQKILPMREGVRVLREFMRPDGAASTETVIFTEMREVSKKPITITPIEEAHYCQSPKDYFQLESRTLISKLLRQYLDERSLTPTELMHHPGEMKKVMAFDSLVPNAVSRVATIQCKASGEDTRERRDAIYAVLDELKGRAEKAAGYKNLPYPREIGFGATMERVEQAVKGDPEEAEYLAKVILCRDLVNIRTLLGKAEWVMELATAGELEERHAGLLDSIVADILSSPETVRDLLGRQPDLGTALLRLMDIIEGRFEPTPKEQAPEVSAVLGGWIAGHAGTQTREVLVDFIQRQIRGNAKLSYGDGEAQRAIFKALLGRVSTVDGILGGPRMAEAFVHGFLRYLEQGGVEGRRLALDGVLGCIPTGAERLSYLVALSGSDYAQKDMQTVLGKARSLLHGAAGVNGLVPPATPLKAKMQSMAGLYTAMANSAFPENDRLRMASTLDDMVADYIVQSRVIEKLDDPSAHLRIRATRLVQFAATDVLSSPKARRIVRDQIIGHLRQPNFDGKLVEGLATAEEKAAVVRNFYDLLNKAQFT